MTETTDGKQSHPSDEKPWLFKPGESGNPAGRPKGSRNKLSQMFLDALVADFQDALESGDQAGAEALRTMRREKPNEYARMIASLLPKEFSGVDGGEIETVQRIILEGVKSDDRASSDS